MLWKKSVRRGQVQFMMRSETSSAAADHPCPVHGPTSRTPLFSTSSLHASQPWMFKERSEAPSTIAAVCEIRSPSTNA